MEKTLKKYKDEVLAVITAKIEDVQKDAGNFYAGNNGLLAEVCKIVRDNLITTRAMVNGVSLDEPEVPKEEVKAP